MDFPQNKKYNIIYCDVPWHYKDKALAGDRGLLNKYKTLSIPEIKALPVSNIAAEDCCLFFWVTFPQLKEAIPVIESWGFKYKTGGFTWIKTNKKNTDSLFWGMGNWTRSNPELCLLATKGKPKRVAANVHSVIQSPIRSHSEKPPEVRDKIVQLCGDVPRIELFSRHMTPGWDHWGLEVGKLGV